MIKAIIFDFNGVIINDDAIHLELFQKVLAGIGIELSDEKAQTYIADSDESVFIAELKANNMEYDVKELIICKADEYTKLIPTIKVFDGVIEFIKNTPKKLAIASGALRCEIIEILKREDIYNKFEGRIIGAEDVEQGKPNPECFLKALELINQRGSESIEPNECMVIEDTPAGVKAAKSADMKCLAVTNTHKKEELMLADEVVNSITEIRR